MTIHEPIINNVAPPGQCIILRSLLNRTIMRPKQPVTAAVVISFSFFTPLLSLLFFR